MSFTKIDEVKFELPKATTWGVKEGKHGRFSIPVSVDMETAGDISELASEHDAKNPLYGDYKTLYLWAGALSEKQTAELLDKKRLKVLVHFKATGVNTSKEGTKYLRFKVTKLRKCETQETEAPAED